MRPRRKGATVPAIFFDIGGTLADAVVAPGNGHLERLDVYPFVIGILKELRTRQYSLGVISNTGTETRESMERALREAGLLEHLQPELLLFSSVIKMRKNSPEIFRMAARAAGQE